MDISMIFLFCFMSIVIGAVLMLIIQYYAFIRYFNISPESKEYKKVIYEKYSLPENIMNSIKSNDPESKYPIVAINLIIQFLFYELKNTNHVRKWFYRKLSLELDELLAKTTTGKLFDKLTIRDLDLGAQFPEIKNLRVHHADLHETEEHIENLDLVLELKYKGNFRLSIDADMVLGKKGSLTLRVKNLEGLARLQFTRKPYTHWSLSFLGDPKLDLDIESQFQGRQMQPNITFLINNQIRKAIRRKHTLPNYKLRYKPFFHNTDDEYNDYDIIQNGKLNIKISELTRLIIPKNITDIYCTLTMSSIAWVEARQQDDKNIIISLDIEIHKAKNQQIGIVFKQNDNIIQIEAILPNTPAFKANLRSGDNLISIDGKIVTTITQVAKIIKNLIKPVFSLRIERIYSGIIRNDAILDDYELYESLSDINISFTKSTESVQIINRNKILRKSSIEKQQLNDIINNTPTNSPRKSQILNNNKKINISRQNSEIDDIILEKNDNNCNCLITKCICKEYNGNGNEIENFQQHSTIDCPVNNFIEMNDLSQFILDERCNYLNICVYGKSISENILLGYVNVPINLILAECSETSLGQYLKKYSLIPPYPQELKEHILSSQSGFISNLCFGDILVTFIWTGNTVTAPTDSLINIKKPKLFKTSSDKLDDDDKISDNKSHNFIRTHFHRSTQCDFCGKKIWLKDAVQCRDCSMCCHKKCINKCQQSTVCGPVDFGSTFLLPKTLNSGSNQPEFTVTEPDMNIDEDSLDECEEPKIKEETGTSGGHRSSFSGLIAQGLKRVNSANNLAIPGIVSSLGQSSRSLPPTPQHTPRKQSLVNQSTNPFIIVTQRLEQIPDNIIDITNDDIANITESLIGHPTDDIMNLAKTSSKNLYADLQANERFDKINTLLSKLRIALDSETSSHATLSQTINNDEKLLSSTLIITESMQQPKDLYLETKAPSSTIISPTLDISLDTNHRIEEIARKSLLLAQSEERVQALSVIMLYLCTGLQHAQGVAFP